MDRVRVNVADKEGLSWPPFCVLCLKPKPEKYVETSCGDIGLSFPYCRNCYDKVTRREKLLVEHSATINAVLSALIGFIAGLGYAVNRIREGGGIEVANPGTWKGALGVGAATLLIMMFVLAFFGALLEPVIDRILLSRFPNKFAKGAVEANFGTRKKVVYPTPDTKVETEEVFLEELEFTNPKYAEKFRKANGLEEK